MESGAEAEIVELPIDGRRPVGGDYALAYFRQIYGERVEVDAARVTQTVTLTEQPLAVEALHLGLAATCEIGRL